MARRLRVNGIYGGSMKRISLVFVTIALAAVTAFGQDRGGWRTSADIQQGARGSITGTVSDTQEGRNRLMLTPDDDRYDQVTVDSDSVSTEYRGFGGVINGAPEIFVGSTGFSNLRVGDRVEVRGSGWSQGVVRAERITLLGRPTPAPQTGVGQTRNPGSISSGSVSGTTPSTAPTRVSNVEGVVQQVNADEGRVVIVTDRREVLTVRTASSTPVTYRGQAYRVSNLEIGDRIRISPVAGSSSTTELRASSIEVTQSAQERGTSRSVGTINGRVTNVDRAGDMITLDTGRGPAIRVDLSTALDTQSRRVRARDVQAGDTLELTGSYNGETFVASTVRFSDQAAPTITQSPARTSVDVGGDLGAVTIYATVSQSLNDSPQLVIRDTQANNRTIRLYVLEDFVIRNKTGGYTTADKLKANDSIVVKAYRDADGNYIAQTIRMR
jgi:hypothetical protein